MHLDGRKLRNDIKHMAQAKALGKRRHLEPVSGTMARAKKKWGQPMYPRSYVIGLPADSKWNPSTIAKLLRGIQVKMGPPTHVHGLLVLGIGYFSTVPAENEEDRTYTIQAWTEADRLFRFSCEFRRSFDRWNEIPAGYSSYVDDYIESEPKVLAHPGQVT
jgi:hypothetical protein